MFILLASVLVVLSGICVAWPWLTQYKHRQLSGDELNKQLRSEQMLDLQNKLNTGEIDQESYEQFVLELNKRLLADVSPVSEQSLNKAPISLLVVVLLFVVFTGIFSYLQLGQYKAQQLTKDYELVMSQDPVDTAKALALFESLHSFAKPLSQDSLNWLIMSAQGYMSLDAFRNAAVVYDDIINLLPNDPQLLSNAAQAHYLNNNRQLSSVSQAYLDKALLLGPTQNNVLGFAGMVAFEQENYAQAVNYWQQVVNTLPPAQGQNNVLVNALATAKQRLASSGQPAVVEQAPAQVEGPVINVSVRLAEGIQIGRNKTVFVTARAISGPPVPLAVKRFTVADLPAQFTLTTADAMSPAFSLTSASNVAVKARISQTGNAIPASGDIQSNIVALDLTQTELQAELLIDSIVE